MNSTHGLSAVVVDSSSAKSVALLSPKLMEQKRPVFVVLSRYPSSNNNRSPELMPVLGTVIENVFAGGFSNRLFTRPVPFVAGGTLDVASAAWLAAMISVIVVPSAVTLHKRNASAPMPTLDTLEFIRMLPLMVPDKVCEARAALMYCRSNCRVVAALPTPSLLVIAELIRVVTMLMRSALVVVGQGVALNAGLMSGVPVLGR